MRTDVLGVRFDDLTLQEAVDRAKMLLRDGARGYVVTPNPEIVWLAREDAGLRQALEDAALVLADGVGVALGAKILGRPLKGTVPGIDFASALMADLQDSGKKLFLFGGKPGVAETAAEQLRLRYPGLLICGTQNGYFEDSEPIAAQINDSGADVVFVCLGAPKQELWMREFGPRLNAALLVGLGGSLDVFAGRVRRAPEGWRRLKLEWLYRLLKEPRRIKRMIKLPLFVFAVLGQRLRGGKNHG